MTKFEVGLAQLSPAWLDKQKTLSKVVDALIEEPNCQLMVFSEALVPGYPFWLEWTGGAQFNNPRQKRLFARYAENAVCIEAGDLNQVSKAARNTKTAVVLGIIERPVDRGAHSLYASLVTIDDSGTIVNVHRKLCPTYEERLVWSPGDGYGLRCHQVGPFTMGALNCWENWMPLPRAALYALGEDLHVMVWPGSRRNTHDITPFLAKEGRSFVVSVAAPFHRSLIPDEADFAEMREQVPEWLTDGGSCIAAPDGSWILEPQVHCEGVFTAELDYRQVLEERQNFDPAGHYSRPDVTQLVVDRTRQSTYRDRP
ncbi:MAG: carbon-nitrogen hydrolase family protein [Acidobacteria bacterium]|nr:carbon-nitrogen hydrolase family protein [Acidobacteriota bacterium]